MSFAEDRARGLARRRGETSPKRAYRVTFRCTELREIWVEAESPGAAIEAAREAEESHWVETLDTDGFEAEEDDDGGGAA